MREFVCLHPVVITNPYNGVRMAVPCGKCEACANNHANKWIEKLERERSSHSFSIFFTLTYSNKYVNKAFLNHDDYFTPDGELLFNIHDADCGLKTNEFSKADWQYINCRRKIYYPNYDFLTNFIKRLRSKLCENEKDLRKRYLRFFINTEYGGDTLRPHHHGILFCDSQWFVENAERLLIEAWSTDGRCSSSEVYGNIDFEPQPVSCASYVAGYINSRLSLPKIYQAKAFKPRCKCSKKPPLGSYFINKEEVREIFDNGTPYHVVYRRKSNEYVRIPVEQCVKDRLFPKCKFYEFLSPYDRAQLYSFLSRTGATCFEEFACYLEKCFNFEIFIDSSLLSYFFKLAQNDTSVYRFYLASRRVYQNCLLFDVSLEVYLQNMDRFYYKEAMYKLQEKYKTDEQLSLQYGSEVLLSLDSVYLESLKRTAPFFTQSQRLTIQSYGLSPDSFSFEKMSMNSTLAYKSFESEHITKFKKSVKTKKRNAYKKSKESNYLSNLISMLYGR